MIVDDNPQNIQVLGNTLRDAGYKIGYALEGQQALNILEHSEGYDLILLDINMPVMDGFSTCQAIRNSSKTFDVPIIFITAYSEMDNVIKGFEYGAQDYITKPFNPKELLVRVETQLQLKYQKDFIKKMNEELVAKVEERTKELKKAYEALNHVDTIKNEFLSLISQEIRMPLNGIVGAVNLIKNQENSSTIRDLVEILNKSVSNLEMFTDNAIYYTRLHDNFKPNFSEFSIRNLLEFALLDKEEVLKEKNMLVSFEGNALLSSINADKDLMYKLFLNILHIFIFNSKGNNKIDVQLHEKDNQLTCILSDNMYAFPDYLIKSFSNTSVIQQNSRLELNLFIVKQVMEVHGGEILMQNNGMNGSMITLTFKK